MLPNTPLSTRTEDVHDDPVVYRPASATKPGAGQRRRVLVGARAVRPSLRRARRPFLVAMPGSPPWLCLTHPDDIKCVFTADTDVLRLGAALAKGSPHPLVLGPTGLTNVDGPEHMRRRRMQLPPFHGQALTNYQAVMQAKTEEALARWPYGRPTRSDTHMQAISLEVMMAVVVGVTNADRVERLRTAILALMREGNSKRFLAQTIIASNRRNGWNAPFPRMRARMAAVDAIVLEEATERRRAGDLDQDDVLGMFLRAPDEHGAPMPDNEVCDAMRTLLLGGHETTASTLAWILERVTRYPDVLKRLEAAAIDGDENYIDAVIKEAMRLRPVFPITARHRTPRGRTARPERPDDPSRHPRRPAHHARSPPPRSLPRPARVPTRTLPRRTSRDLHLDPVRRRTQTLHRRRVLTHRNPNRAPHNPPKRPAATHQQALRTRRQAHRHDRPRRRSGDHAPSPSAPATCRSAHPSHSLDRRRPGCVDSAQWDMSAARGLTGLQAQPTARKGRLDRNGWRHLLCPCRDHLGAAAGAPAKRGARGSAIRQRLPTGLAGCTGSSCPPLDFVSQTLVALRHKLNGGGHARNTRQHVSQRRRSGPPGGGESVGADQTGGTAQV